MGGRQWTNTVHLLCTCTTFVIYTVEDAGSLTLWRSSDNEIKSSLIVTINKKFFFSEDQEKADITWHSHTGSLVVWAVDDWAQWESGPTENATSWSAISLLYIELDKQRSLTFLSGVPATHCLRLHSRINRCVGKICQATEKHVHSKYNASKLID